MERTSILRQQILMMANRVPDCAMEDVQAGLPDYRWNQIFLEVDRMSRNGQLRLSLKRSGSYQIFTAGGGSRQAVDPSFDQ